MTARLRTDDQESCAEDVGGDDMGFSAIAVGMQ